jgi:hypothetical protein
LARISDGGLPPRQQRTWRSLASVALLIVAAKPMTAAESPTELLEKGIYAEETQGDLGAAIAIYKRVAEAARSERPAVAQALYRLGMCYLKSGRRNDAAATFEKLARQHAEETALLARIPPSVSTVPLLPAPWGQEETLLMRIRGQQRDHLSGVTIFRTKETLLDGKPVTHLDTHWHLAWTAIVVDRETMRPMYRTSKVLTRPSHPSEVFYDRASIDLFLDRQLNRPKGEPKRLPQSSSSTIYDYDEIIPMIRRLPLVEGYSLHLHVLEREDARIHEGKIEVLARERVTVAAGTFETFKVGVTFADGYSGDVDLEGDRPKVLWYSADAHRYPVKMQDGWDWELAGIRGVAGNDRVVFRDAASGVSLSAPPAWFLVQQNAPEAPLHVRLIHSRLGIVGDLTRWPIPANHSTRTAQQMAADFVNMARRSGIGKARNIRVDGLPETLDLNGIPAARVVYTGDGGDDKVPIVGCKVLVSHDQHPLAFQFAWIAPEQWPSFRPELDELVQSLRIKTATGD